MHVQIAGLVVLSHLETAQDMTLWRQREMKMSHDYVPEEEGCTCMFHLAVAIPRMQLHFAHMDKCLSTADKDVE